MAKQFEKGANDAMKKELILKNNQGEVFATVSGTTEHIEYLASFIHACFIDEGIDPGVNFEGDAIEIIEAYPNITKIDKLSFDTKSLQEREYPEWDRGE
ncbi:hypothetical protein [Paenibacillus sp. 22594]|uniref:hypothetical protein n=1 Tax=Paenibacillus sp. 22594 TaxID=3453947 RepID=UPI003F86E23F